MSCFIIMTVLSSAQISNSANKAAIENEKKKKKVLSLGLGFICGLPASKQSAIWWKRTNKAFIFCIIAKQKWMCNFF